MKTEIWSNPDISQTIETMDFHCEKCGGRWRMVLPPAARSYEKEYKYYRDLAIRLNQRLIAAERMMNYAQANQPH